MPIPRDDVEPDDLQANTGLLEFINRRRVHQARQRRQRVLVAATAALALIAIVLAVSNVLLIRRLAGRVETAPPASVTPPAPVASAPAVPDTERAPASAPPAAIATARPSPTAEPAPPTATRPPRGEPQTAPAPPAPEPAMVESDPARRTARWLVETHGRLEAENRATKVAEFYSGSERAFWRRVLLNVRREPER